jgi:predicted transposase/invertase (TIGR01784 family)
MIMKQVEERYISLLTDFGFDRLFEEAEIAKFTPQEMREYETSKMAYRDIKNSVDTAKREGLAEGIEIGMNQKAQDIAKNMLAMGLSAEQVAKATQLSLEIIKNLSNS